MNTIQRLGERETVDRIINGTLKSYVDRDIDTADTSAFENLEVLNVPKAESVVIGEGVKDTLTVLNAPKAESVMTYDAVSEGNIEGLGDLPNLKVADVASMDVDVPMFKGCTNLERATIGGKKNPTEVGGVTTYPTLDSSYFEGCTNLSEVTITNPYLKFNNAIPSTVDLYADDSKLPSDGLLEYSKYGLPPVTVTMATYLQANNSGYRVKGAEQIDYPFPLGGKIFYIDPTDNGATYTFFDENFAEITGWSTISDLANAKWYKKKGTSTGDKFYVYHDELYTSNRWTYYKNGAYVYDTIGSLQQTIGSGKSNTATMMARDDGSYITDNSNGYPTIWYQLQRTRNAKAGGCDDWFIPSRYEIEELRKAIGFQVVTTSDDPVILSAGTVTGGVIAGTADGSAHYKDYSSTRTCYPSATKFLDNYIWSSSESSAQFAWLWDCYYQYWASYGKSYSISVFFVRAF